MYEKLYETQVKRSCDYARAVGFLQGRIRGLIIELTYPTKKSEEIIAHLEKTLEESEKLTQRQEA